MTATLSPEAARDGVDTQALRVARGTVEQGGVIGVFPEGNRGAGDMVTSRSGAAYLALVSGAPVVPVAFLGSRAPGGHSDSIPRRGSRIAMTIGEPLHLGWQPWPRTKAMVAQSAALVTAAIIQTIREAERRTGITLPGPLGARPDEK